MISQDKAELIVRRAFDSWFGEPLESMEDESRVRRFFFGPLCRDIAKAIDEAAPPSCDREAGWQPIETAPKDRSFIFYAANQGVPGPAECMWSGSRWHAFGCTGGFTCHPTHWMPLPAPPSNAGEGGK